ncbi:MAG: sugar ABC transporter permease [Actinobacteria bacterium]|nr:sugar ABC transporter permease [Actinomycetota bacterium]
MTATHTDNAKSTEKRRDWRSVLTATEIDTRLAGMVAALAVIWVAFHILSGGDFLTSRNLWNLSVQSTSIAIMATGMVLIIVSRNIDLSVGSLLGLLGYVMAMVQTRWIPDTFDLGFGRWYTWIVALIVGIALGAALGAVQGAVVAYGGVPAFIVTLGGFLVWRGLIFRMGEQGQTLSPLDDTFSRLGGGPNGSLGEMRSWILGLIGCAGVSFSIYLARRRRRRYDLGVRPLAIDVCLAVFGCIVILAGIAFVAVGYESPISGDPTGVAYPVVILILVTIGMVYISRRRRFGRYVYAIGGNPEAAELGGINTRKTLMLTFVLMGVLCAISAAIQTARLDAAVTNLGVQNELDVISAAVIGGTSFAGGIGTITGAVLGAVIMQSLRSGMVLLRIDSPSQDIVVGVVLVSAVAVDAALRLGKRRLAGIALTVGLVLAALIVQTGRQ